MSKKRDNRGFPIKNRSEIQSIPADLMLFSNVEITKCYEHFAIRFKERYKHTSTNLSYKDYWFSWICFLRGQFSHFTEQDKMVRIIGNYIKKDPSMYKIIYTKIVIKNNNVNDLKDFELYIPLTLYELETQKEKVHSYRRIILNKKLNGVSENIQ